MLKKTMGLLASVLLFVPNAFAKSYELDSRSVELNNDFLGSLDEDQRTYLEEQLGKTKYSDLSEEDSEFLFIDMDEVEMAESSGPDDHTTQTFPEL